MSALVETMFYYGETPWHGLGKEVLSTLTAEEAIKAAGLDWEVEVVPVYHQWNNRKIEIADKAAIRRTTDGNVLAVLSPRYTPVQNREAFNFFDSVTATGEAKYHTAGSLIDGHRVWILAKLNGGGPIKVKTDDIDKYLLLMNGHDGIIALKMFFTPVRVVCNNTLMAAEAGAHSLATFRAKHVGNLAAKMERAREILGMTMKFYDTFAEKANWLASHQLPTPKLPLLLAAAFGTSGAIRPEDIIKLDDFGERRKKEMVKVEALFGGEGKGLDKKGIKGTAWAAYNAVVEYVDYARAYRGDNAADNRLSSVWLGTGKYIKQRAWDYLMAQKV